MGTFIDITGKRFGRLLVIEKSDERDRFNKIIWKCVCDCGKPHEVTGENLRSSHIQSCGCLHHDPTTHGQSGSPKHKRSREYEAWAEMRKRCYNQNYKQYKDYGGRGITVCERWNSFQNFFTDMGEKPEGKTLGRKNNDGHYEPSNCEWQTWSQQNNNRRVRIDRVFYGGFTAQELARRCGLHVNTVHYRMKQGWTVKRMLRNSGVEVEHGKQNL